MALSNWDTLAMTSDGEPSDGVFISPLGVKVEIYKNWLYVHDAEGWKEGGKYIEPVVMEIQDGNVQYKDVSVLVVRGPQEGVYVLVWSGYRYNDTFVGMAGCGVYGFDDSSEWVGVDRSSLQFLKKWIEERVVKYDVSLPDGSKFLSSEAWDASVRFNQGDAYFAAHVGTSVPGTPPGEAESPILMQMLATDRSDEAK